MRRKYALLKSILQKDEPITINELAQEFGVSEKTVRNDLASLNSLLYRYNLNLVKKPSIGTYIEGNLSDKQSLLEFVSSHNMRTVSPDERQRRILERLLFSNQQILIKELSIDFYVSRSTITNDIKCLNDFLQEFDLKIENKRSEGLSLHGSETNKRKVFVKLFPEVPSLNTVNERLIPNVVENNKMVTQLFEKLDLDVQKLIAILKDAEKKLGYTFTAEAFLNLIVHLGIAINRAKNRYFIEFNSKTKEKLRENAQEFEIAKFTAKSIEEQYQVQLHESEFYNILLHFLGAKTIRAKLNLDFKIVMQDDNLEYLTKQLIRNVQNELNMFLENDTHLYNNLVLHLKPTINRLRYNLSLINPLKDDIIKNYYEIYNVVLDNISILNNGLNITLPEDEIAYLVLHFAASVERNKKNIRTLVACSSGIGISQLIVTKLVRRFRNIEIVAVISVLEIENYLDKDIDLIISTINIGQIENIKTVVVNPLLNENDIVNISSSIQMIYGNHVGLNFNKNRVYEIDESNKVRILEFINKKLLENDMVTKSYLNSLIKREKSGSTYIGHGTAIVHGSMREVKSSTIQVIRLKKPIVWEKISKVNFIINVVSTNHDSEFFSLLFKKFGMRLDDEEFWDRIQTIKDKQELCSFLNKELDLA